MATEVILPSASISIVMIAIVAAVVIVFGYVLFARIRMRNKNGASDLGDKNAYRSKHKQQQHHHHQGRQGTSEGGSESAAGGPPSADRRTAAGSDKTTGSGGGGRKVVATASSAGSNANSSNTGGSLIKKQRASDPANYQHPWLYTTLKRHTGQVFDMDFSANGKYLATCAEDSPSVDDNHLINGSINENDGDDDGDDDDDELNGGAPTPPTTRSLSPASSTSSSLAFSGSDISDGLRRDGGGNTSSSCCTSANNADVSEASSSSSSNRGSNSSGSSPTSSPNAHASTSSCSASFSSSAANKKQRKFTKRKSQSQKKPNNGGTKSSHGNNAGGNSGNNKNNGGNAGNKGNGSNAVYARNIAKASIMSSGSSSSLNEASSSSTQEDDIMIKEFVPNKRENAASSQSALSMQPLGAAKSVPTLPGTLISSCESQPPRRPQQQQQQHQQQSREAQARLLDYSNSRAMAKNKKNPNQGMGTSHGIAMLGVSSKHPQQQQQQHATNPSPPLRQYMKLNLTENDLVRHLRKYILDKDVMKQLGFPVEYGLDADKAIIYKFPNDFFRPTPVQHFPQQQPQQAVTVEEAEEIVPVEGDKSDDNDSGQGSSGTSSPTNVDVDVTVNDTLLMYRLASTTTTSTTPSATTALSSPLNADLQLQPSAERECCRCGKGFFVTLDGEYLTHEHCIYHWGRLVRIFTGPGASDSRKAYSCCNGDPEVRGCTINKRHVWTGLLAGFNGPFEGFVRTQPSPRKLKKFKKLLMSKFYYQSGGGGGTDPATTLSDELFFGEDDESDGVYALDCEMSYTGRGLELTKVTVVAADGGLVYERLVKPEAEIVDYNTRYSGVTEADFSNPRNYVSLAQVQQDLLRFIFDDTILIGHSIENDLKVLKLIHKTVIDTSITFPHMNGFPFRQSLKSLAKNILKRDIQTTTSSGSSSIGNNGNHHTSSIAADQHNTNSSSSSSSSGSDSGGHQFGHCSLEDSRASLELMLWRVRKDKALYENLWSANRGYTTRIHNS